MKNLILTLLVLSATVSYAQVGINTNTPQAALDVVGDVKLDNSLFLENPGDNTNIRGSKLLILSTDDDLLEYDINTSKYGPINYVEYQFNDVSEDGLVEYDTKISITDYLVVIQGYYFLEAGTGDTDVMVNSNNDDDNIEGYQIYAYPNTVTQTWCIKAIVNDSKFYTKSGSTMAPSSIDLFLNTVIYRKGFISKSLTPMTIDMSNSETGIAPLPTGF